MNQKLILKGDQKLTLSDVEVALVLDALGFLPFNKVSVLITKIFDQCRAQQEEKVNAQSESQGSS